MRRALDAEPDNGAYLDSLGWAHFRRGDLDEAEKYLAAAAASRCPRTPRFRIISAICTRAGAGCRRRLPRGRGARRATGEDVERAAIEKKISNAKGKMQNAK